LDVTQLGNGSHWTLNVAEYVHLRDIITNDAVLTDTRYKYTAVFCHDVTALFDMEAMFLKK